MGCWGKRERNTTRPPTLTPSFLLSPLSVCHGSREWHKGVIDSIRRLNKEKG